MVTRKTKSNRIGFLGGAALLLMAVAGGIGYQNIGRISSSLDFPVRAVLEMLPSVFNTAWHLLLPCGFSHICLLLGLMRIPVSPLQLVLTLAGVA